MATATATSILRYFDGPHVTFPEKDMAEVFYYALDEKNECKSFFQNFALPDSKYKGLIFKGFKVDDNYYQLRRQIEIPEAELSCDERIMVFGDIHGGYNELVGFLQKNGVVDNNTNWTWGKGHLVFTGDVFDRGNQVTECLWFIHKLEQQAEITGGMVHYLLGNHEIMAIENDTRYLSEKYHFLCNSLGINYNSFYSIKTYLGQWLRSKNAILRINDILFAHGGISKELLNTKADLNLINEVVHNNLLLKPVPATNLSELVFKSYGPFWYRGYVSEWLAYNKMTEEEIQQVLSHFKVKTIVVGHTNIDKISLLHSGKVIATDIPYYIPGFHLESLLIDGKRLYRCLHEGSRVGL